MPKIDPPEPESEDGDFPDPSSGTNGTENEEFLSLPARKSTVAKLRRFILAYTETGLVHKSCKIAGIGKMSHYRRLRNDAGYQRAFEEAQEQVGQELEDLAVERVREGNRRLVLYQGEPVFFNGEPLYEIEYDAHLHHVLLRRFRPLLYRDRSEVAVSGTINIAERLQAARKRLIEMRRADDFPTDPAQSA